MTHVFEVPSIFFHSVESEKQTFDILNFGPRVSVGDTVIYQRLADSDYEEDENGEINNTHISGDEIAVTIEILFDDSEKCLKKGYTAFGFKLKE